MIFYSIVLGLSFALTIPKPVSMKSLEKLNPKESFLNVLWNFLLHYRWVISGVIFFLISFYIFYLVWRNLNKTEEKSLPSEEIYLQGRKVLLPRSELMKGVEKYYLSEDFDETPLNNDSNEIYQETIISKLKLSNS